MSNLTSTVKFDVLRGWPHEGAVEESFKVASGVTVKEGMIVVLNSSGELVIPSTAAPAITGTVADPVQYRMVIQGNDQYDGSFVGKAVTLRGEFTVQTEKYSGTMAVGAYLTVEHTGGSAGFLKERTGAPYATAQMLGQIESYDSTGATIVVAMKL